MKKIIFLCHGNICRSPMAEYILKKLAAERGTALQITSAAVSDEETGNPIYPPAARTLREHGIPFGDHRAHKITPQEYGDHDLVLIMDESNRRLLQRLVGPDTSGKVHLLTEYTGTPKNVADPWYTGDFETAYQDITAACQALLNTL